MITANEVSRLIYLLTKCRSRLPREHYRWSLHHLRVARIYANEPKRFPRLWVVYRVRQARVELRPYINKLDRVVYEAPVYA